VKSYIRILGLATIMLFVFTSCYETEGATIQEQDTPAQARLEQAEPMQDAPSQSISWQDAYAERLRYYALQPTNPTAAEWRFMLHDINQDGTPQLFLVMYYTGLREHYAVYSFANGETLRLKTALGLGHEFNSGIILPPGGATGIIRVMANGVIYRYDMMALSGTTLSHVANGTFSKMADVFALNAFHVTQEEFEDIFGKRDEKVWLALHEITEANIQDIVFGQLLY